MATIKKKWTDFIQAVNLLNMILSANQKDIADLKDKKKKRTPEEQKEALEKVKSIEADNAVLTDIAKHFNPVLDIYNEKRDWIQIDTAMVEAEGPNKGALLLDDKDRYRYTKEGEHEKQKRFKALADSDYDFPILSLSADKAFYVKDDKGKDIKSERRFTFLDGFVIFDKPAPKATRGK